LAPELSTEKDESSNDCLRLKPMVAEMRLDEGVVTVMGVKMAPVVVYGQKQVICRGESTMG